MTNNELRNVALLMQAKVKELYAAIAPSYAEVSNWTLNLSDAKLPTIAQVKAVLLAYAAIEKPSLALYDELREIKSATETAATLPEGLVTSVDWANVENKPTTYQPATHAHVKADVTDFPATLPGRMAVVSWVGNGAASRIVSFSGGFVPRYGLVEYVAVGWALPCMDGIHWSSVSETAITIDAALNTNGYTYRMFILE